MNQHHLPRRHRHAQPGDRPHRHDPELHRGRGQSRRERPLESRRQRRERRRPRSPISGIASPSPVSSAARTPRLRGAVRSEKTSPITSSASPGRRASGIKITDPALRQTTDINFPGAAARSRRISTRFGSSSHRELDAEWFVLAGSLPPGVGAAIYRDLILDAPRAGQSVVLDASGEPLRLALEAEPHLVKPNIHELGSCSGRRSTTRSRSDRRRARAASRAASSWSSSRWARRRVFRHRRRKSSSRVRRASKSAAPSAPATPWSPASSPRSSANSRSPNARGSPPPFPSTRSLAAIRRHRFLRPSQSILHEVPSSQPEPLQPSHENEFSSPLTAAVSHKPSRSPRRLPPSKAPCSVRKRSSVSACAPTCAGDYFLGDWGGAAPAPRRCRRHLRRLLRHQPRGQCERRARRDRLQLCR